MVLLQRKLYFSKDRGGPTFLGGGPITPLDLHMVSSLDNSTSLHV